MKRDVFAFTRPLAAVVTLILFSVIALTAQTPTAFNYQAVLRDGDGNLRANASVVLKLDIHQSTETGIVVYTETHNTTSDDFGIVNLKLGSVSPGSFAALNWSAGPYFVEVMVDGTSMGVSELLAVPYALHANTANTAISDAVDDADPDPANELNATVVLNGATLEVSDAGGTLTADLSSLVDDADPDPANELNSTVALNVHTLEVSDAGGTLTADLSALVDDADPDPTNELNSTVVLNGTLLEVTDAGGTLTADLALLVNDADPDPTNELNSTVVLNANTLEVTDAGGTLTADLSALVDDADPDPTNELNSTVVLNGTILEVTDAGGTLTADLSAVVDDADPDPTNELQELSLIGTTLYLSDDGSVALPVVGPAGAEANDLISFDGSNWVARGALINNAGAGQAVNNMQPWIGINHVIALQGVFPARNSSNPLLAEIMLFAGNFAPRGWAFCDGQLLPIVQNSALFSLLGTTYGGDGRTTFALPDLRGRTAIHPGTGAGLSTRRLGERGGSETNTLTIMQMPVHNHTITYD